jgi:acyl-coenzyme A synthetase/AMP-(fatty) acid ligase
MGTDGIEEIVVVIVARAPVSEQTIIDWCAEHRIPVARVMIVDELPKTASGKIHRDLIKRQYGS